MSGTMRFRSSPRRRHRARQRLWTVEFAVWCVAMLLISAAAGVFLTLIAEHFWR
jgi:hypothetical protein